MDNARKPDIFDEVSLSIVGADDAKAGIAQWGTDCCVVDPTSTASGEYLYQSYILWAKSIGAPVCTERAFLVYLGSRGVPKGMKKGARVWMGLRVKPEYVSKVMDDAQAASTDWIDDIAYKVEKWIIERCVMDGPKAHAGEWADELYFDFTQWNGDKRIGRVGFGQALKRFKGVLCHQRRQKAFANGEVMLRTIYTGIALINKEEPKKPGKPAAIAPAPAPAQVPQRQIQPADNFFRDDPVPDDWDEEL